MARDSKRTRQRILKAAFALFYRHGFARVGVDAIAQASGVTKRTLYDHFRSKDELLAAVLELHHELALAHIQRWAGRLPGDVPAAVEMLFDELAAWAAKPRWTGPGFTRLVMELADLPGHPARAIARRHKRAVEAWFAAEFARRSVRSAEERAREIMLLLEGATA